MSLPLHKIYLITRPRFWLYTAGTYAVGVIAGVSTWHQMASWYVVLYALSKYYNSNIKRGENDCRNNTVLFIAIVSGA